MKKFTKLLGIVLIIALVMSISVSAFAEDPVKGTLTVKNSEEDVTYNFYKIFDLTGQDTAADTETELYNAVAYTIDSDWSTFFTGVGAEYIVETNTGNLNPIKIDGVTKYINITDANKVKFTNDAMAYAINSNLSADKTAAGVATGDVTVSGLDLGYYLMVPVDMTDEKANPVSTGSIASLTSTIPTGEIYVKATKPSIGKKDNAATVDVGQTVEYEVTGKVPNTSGTATFVYQISDTMSKGLTFKKDVVATIGEKTLTTSGEKPEMTITYTDTGFVADIAVTALQDYKGETITLKYHAVVNDDAVTVDQAHNTAQLKYGRNPDKLEESTPISEEVYTAKIIINKYTGESASSGTKLPDAVFALMKLETTGTGSDATTTAKFYKYTAATATTPATVTWVPVTNGPTAADAVVTDAMVAALEAAGAEAITLETTNANGAAEFPGIADGTYYLVEVAAPDGYNRIDKPQEVIVAGTDVDNKTTHLENVAYAGDTFDSHNNPTADVQNNTGTVLPSTGGIGTTIFYVVGSILVVAAGVLLITKKRMSREG
jgi:fimbrial isopeptide formation D2 family protein/LPXTG-motif cell wall-anchored protein